MQSKRSNVKKSKSKRVFMYEGMGKRDTLKSVLFLCGYSTFFCLLANVIWQTDEWKSTRDRRNNEIERKWFLAQCIEKDERGESEREGKKWAYTIPMSTDDDICWHSHYFYLNVCLFLFCYYFCLLAAVAGSVFVVVVENHISSLICSVIFSSCFFCALHFHVSFNNKNEQLTNSPALLKYFKNKYDSNMKQVNEQRLKERKKKQFYWIWNAIFIRRMTLLISIIFFVFVRSFVGWLISVLVVFYFVLAHCFCLFNISFISFVILFMWLYLNTTLSFLLCMNPSSSFCRVRVCIRSALAN